MSSPPEGFADSPILSPRGALFIAREDQLPAMQELHDELRAEGNFEELDEAGIRGLQPLVSEGYAAAGLYDVNCEDIDVATLHQGFLRRARARGCTTVTKAEVLSLEQLGDGWRVHTTAGQFEAPRVVNAAGADALGQMAAGPSPDPQASHRHADCRTGRGRGWRHADRRGRAGGVLRLRHRAAAAVTGQRRPRRSQRRSARRAGHCHLRGPGRACLRLPRRPD